MASSYCVVNFGLTFPPGAAFRGCRLQQISPIIAGAGGPGSAQEYTNKNKYLSARQVPERIVAGSPRKELRKNAPQIGTNATCLRLDRLAPECWYQSALLGGLLREGEIGRHLRNLPPSAERICDIDWPAGSGFCVATTRNRSHSPTRFQPKM